MSDELDTTLTTEEQRELGKYVRWLQKRVRELVEENERLQQRYQQLEGIRPLLEGLQELPEGFCYDLPDPLQKKLTVGWIALEAVLSPKEPTDAEEESR